ncbi:hypothetical protein FEF26_10095 [Nesterenkonia salmonea]|uniref:histidine kinase n=1 Tax=Nesterenkonia salmonea TaxID=1804987 RepID=A0A5R9BB73_9MICC|nr:histidine kinase [Nesterenkonia salmonea]TLP95857.1 hypothetical protein FEF26_10095 [Nesterenkonia salmonea]
MRRNHRAHLQSAAYVVPGVVGVFAGWAGPTGMPWWDVLGVEPNHRWHLVTLAAMGGVMVMKIRRPTVALVLGCACVAVDLSFGLSLGVLICLTDLIYNHGIRAPARRVKATERVLGVLVVSLVAAALVFNTLGAALNMLLLATAILMVPLWWAAEVRRGYPAFVEDQVRHRLEGERHSVLITEQKRRRASAVEAERRRMARELHDIVSSQVASIALTSGAVLNSPPEAERDRHALGVIRASSVKAMDELRHMVHMLRSQSGEDDDATSLLTETTWDRVLAEARWQGLSVEVDGQPPEDLEAGVRTVLVRVLHESLINALRHGQGTVDVKVHAARRQLMLTVESDLRDATEPVSDQGTGTGIIAMRERVHSIGGTFSAGKSRERWTVQAELPLARHAVVKASRS